MHRHEVDSLVRDLLRRHDQVTLVLARLVIGHYHHLAPTNRRDGILDTVECCLFVHHRSRPTKNPKTHVFGQ